jgi:hypothetical protein
VIPDHHHRPPFCRGRITVELHTSNSVHVSPEVAWARTNANSEELEWAGRFVRVPSVTELAWSAITHGLEDQIGSLRLKRFLEVAALASEGAPVDWNTLLERIRTHDGFGPIILPRHGLALTRGWLDAAMALTAPARRPTGLEHPRFDLAQLLRWRLTVLASRPQLGLQFTSRLLEEGARAPIGWTVAPSPRTASSLGRVRRWTAVRVSRLAFGMWQRRQGRDATAGNPAKPASASADPALLASRRPPG